MPAVCFGIIIKIFTQCMLNRSLASLSLSTEKNSSYSQSAFIQTSQMKLGSMRSSTSRALSPTKGPNRLPFLIAFLHQRPTTNRKQFHQYHKLMVKFPASFKISIRRLP